MKIVHKCACGRRVRPRINPPPRKHEILYYAFIDQVIEGLPALNLPEFGKKYRRLVRVTAKQHKW
ncbi:unnamed protein product, partial [marine sediment metagenome]